MNYIISNSEISAQISSKGGELQSVRSAAGKEYLWQGDTEIWEDRAPNLFPYIARLTEGSYWFQGKKYHMDIHGFLPSSEMEFVEKTEDSLALKLETSEETLKQYPFNFVLLITWKVKGSTLDITYQVENKDSRTMYFGIGGHPGFIVPLEENRKFEDYRIDFGGEVIPQRVNMSEDCFVMEGEKPLELKDGRYLNLCHNLFDHDAIILKDMPRQVRINCAGGAEEITLTFPKMNYLGIWHRPFKTPDYVCVEPWSSLPSRKGIVEDIEKQPGLISLESGKTYQNSWSITISASQNKK